LSTPTEQFLYTRYQKKQRENLADSLLEITIGIDQQVRWLLSRQNKTEERRGISNRGGEELPCVLALSIRNSSIAWKQLQLLHLQSSFICVEVAPVCVDYSDRQSHQHAYDTY
jgi:hypothetical protein